MITLGYRKSTNKTKYHFDGQLKKKHDGKIVPPEAVTITLISIDWISWRLLDLLVRKYVFFHQPLEARWWHLFCFCLNRYITTTGDGTVECSFLSFPPLFFLMHCPLFKSERRWLWKFSADLLKPSNKKRRKEKIQAAKQNAFAKSTRVEWRKKKRERREKGRHLLTHNSSIERYH